MSAVNLCTSHYLERRKHEAEAASKKAVLACLESMKTSASTISSTAVSTIAVSVGDSSSERSEDTWSLPSGIVWEHLRFGDQIQPYCRYAHRVDDVHLLSRFLELAEVSDVDGYCVKLLLRAFKLLWLCDYSKEDMCCILAHASAYFLDAYALCGAGMDSCEVGHALVTLMFLAHSYVQDETCPLHVWHKYLFKRYCALKTLNAAVVRLMEIRKYRLGLDEDDLQDRYARLWEAAPPVQESPTSLTITPCWGCVPPPAHIDDTKFVRAAASEPDGDV